MNTTSAANPPLTATDLSRLRWRSRRGLLENDLLMERFFSQHASALTEHHRQGLEVLLDLSDNDLLDYLLGRASPPQAWPTAAQDVLTMMRPTPADHNAL